MNGLPETNQRDAEQSRRDNQQSRSFHRVDVMPAMMVEPRLILRLGGHGDIVALYHESPNHVLHGALGFGL